MLISSNLLLTTLLLPIYPAASIFSYLRPTRTPRDARRGPTPHPRPTIEHHLIRALGLRETELGLELMGWEK
jgi:hypothetical protein